MKLKGKVKDGLKIGRELGYPTANLEIVGDPISGTPEIGSRYIASGVYAASVAIGGKRYEGVCVVGARYEEEKPLVEVHLFDFNGNAYGKTMEVELYDKVSDIGKLESHLLVQKIQDDIRKVREWFLSKSSKASKSGKSST